MILFFLNFALDLNIDCPGTQSEQAGKTSVCQGCPNQNICASGKAREPDPGILFYLVRKKNKLSKIIVFLNYRC